jgi:N-acetylglucosamine-6-phosphate deacetylase
VQILPSLGPAGHRRAEDGAESLGAHLEGPFINPVRNGIHKPDVLRACSRGFQDLGNCYGVENIPVLGREGDEEKMDRDATVDGADSSRGSTVKMITAAPEVGEMLSNIREIRSRGIIYSIGHSDATYEQALAAVHEGATMVTHLFNAMRPFSHRDPGILGLLGQREQPRPFFGVIADGIHLHPTSVQIAFHTHSDGLILVTDAMWLCGLPDGEYEWTNDEHIVKTGALLTLAGSDKIAGSSTTLIECINNFWRWTGATAAEAINAATATPARMLGLEGIKGSLQGDADADLVVLGETTDAENGSTLTVKQVWKFGVKIFDVEKHGDWED